MDIKSVLTFLSLAGGLMLVVGGFIAITSMAQGRNPRNAIMLALVGLLVFLLFSLASTGLVVVSSTEVAVVFQQVGGKLWEPPLGPGVHIIMPVINQTYIYSTEVQNYTMSKTQNEGQVRGDDAIEARTSDGQAVTIDVAVLYRIDPAGANLVHTKFQGRIQNDFIRPNVRAEVRKILANYSVQDLYAGAGLNTTSTQGTASKESKLPEIETKIFESLKPQFKANGLDLQTLLLREVTFSEEFIKAVEERQVAEQAAQRAQQEAQRARTIAQGNADAAVTAAKGESNALIAKAEGESQAILLRAKAEAEALALIAKQLEGNPMLIQWRYIEKLAGNIRMILVPSNSPYLFDFNSMLGTTTDNPATDATIPTPAPSN